MSLRVRLPLLFLAGIVLAGLVTTAIAVTLFRNFAHDQTVTALRNEAAGISQLYGNAVKESYDQSNSSDNRKAPTFARKNLEEATGDLIYFDGAGNPFPGDNSGLRPLHLKTIDWQSGKSLTFQFTPPGKDHSSNRTASAPFRLVTSTQMPVSEGPTTAVSEITPDDAEPPVTRLAAWVPFCSKHAP